MSLFLGFLEYENLELSPANLRFLDSPEKERLNQLSNKIIKSQFLAGRILAKSLLSAELDIAIHSVKIEIQPSGRPTNPANIQFSLSHSNGLAACVAGQGSLGLDLERRVQRKNYISIARDYFHEPEITSMKCENSAKSLQLFYEYWTVKEAYIKANNMSIWNLKLVPPTKMSEKSDRGNPDVESHSGNFERSHIEAVSYALSDEYILTIASSPAPSGIAIAPDFPLPEGFNLSESKRYTFDSL